MKRPMKRAYTSPVADRTAPTIKKAVFMSRVRRLPYCWDGPLAIKLPIQAPTMVRDVASDASTNRWTKQAY